jgi:hypothetical protein
VLGFEGGFLPFIARQFGHREVKRHATAHGPKAKLPGQPVGVIVTQHRHADHGLVVAVKNAVVVDEHAPALRWLRNATKTGACVSGKQVEHFLACLYTGASLRARFLLKPERVALAAGLGAAGAAGMGLVDMVGLQMAARSFASKHEGRRQVGEGTSMRHVGGSGFAHGGKLCAGFDGEHSSMSAVLKHIIQGGGIGYTIKPGFNLFLGGIFELLGHTFK